MKKSILYLIGVFAFIGTSRVGAELQSTRLYFEGKNGLQDSLEIALGLTEDEIGALPLLPLDSVLLSINDSTHWVWLTKMAETVVEGKKTFVPHGYRTYVYQPYTGNIERGKQRFYIPAGRMPVIIRWDKHFFTENGLIGSLISDAISWDVMGDDEEYHDGLPLAYNDSCIIHGVPEETAYAASTYDCWGEDLYLKQAALMLGTSANTKFQAIDNIPTEPSSPVKLLRDGQLYLMYKGIMYNVQGYRLGD